GDHLVVQLLHEPGQALSQEHRVVGDHDAHGTSAVIRVGPPTGLSTRRVPSTRASRSRRPTSPWPLARSAPPRPSSTMVSRAEVPWRETVMAARVESACLATFVRASAAVK